MSEFEDAFDRVKAYIDDHEKYDGSELIDVGYGAGIDLWLSDMRYVIDRLDKMIKEQREEALSDMAKHDAELILKGY